MATWGTPPFENVTAPAATVADAHRFWPDSSSVDDDTLEQLLAASWVGCQAYAPPIPLDADGSFMSRMVVANVLDARDLWTAYRRDGDVIGFETYAVRVRPLSATVRALLRPPRGVPMVG